IPEEGMPRVIFSLSLRSLIEGGNVQQTWRKKEEFRGTPQKSLPIKYTQSWPKSQERNALIFLCLCPGCEEAYPCVILPGGLQGVATSCGNGDPDRSHFPLRTIGDVVAAIVQVEGERGSQNHGGISTEPDWRCALLATAFEDDIPVVAFLNEDGERFVPAVGPVGVSYLRFDWAEIIQGRARPRKAGQPDGASTESRRIKRSGKVLQCADLWAGGRDGAGRDLRGGGHLWCAKVID